VLYCNYHLATGTQPTGWNYTGQTTASFIYWEPVWTSKPAPVLPKAWRWYDTFRTWAEPKALLLLDGCKQAIRRAQERLPMQQRRKQKRKAYMQNLYETKLQ
jgi:hypothetical protein